MSAKVSSKEDDIRAIEVFELSKQGFSPRRIAEAKGVPVGEVYRLLKAVQKKLVKEKGA